MREIVLIPSIEWPMSIFRLWLENTGLITYKILDLRLIIGGEVSRLMGIHNKSYILFYSTTSLTKFLNLSISQDSSLKNFPRKQHSITNFQTFRSFLPYKNLHPLSKQPSMNSQLQLITFIISSWEWIRQKKPNHNYLPSTIFG